MGLIDIQNLRITNHDGHNIIDGIDLTIYPHKINALIGESGAGKSLTAKALLDFLPLNITCHYDQYLFESHPVKDIHTYFGRKIGYISQNYAQSFNDHTKLGKQLIAIYRTHFNVSKKAALAKVTEALTWVNLNDASLLERYSFQLSGGQLERIYIASVLMLDPQLIIADEPVASLDILNGYKVMELLEHVVRDHHNTLLIITHNMSHVLKYSDYINILKDGHIVDKGSIEHFNNSHLHPYTKQLINYRTKLKRDSYD